MTKTLENSVLTASVPSPELITEVESHFYTYCKVIIRNVIEPVLLALCDRPRFDAQILPRMKTVDSILNNSPHFTTTNQESGNHPSVKELDFELKGLKNDLKTIMQIQEALAITDNHGSMEVISPMQEIHRTIARIQRETSADQHLYRHILAHLCASLQDIDNLFQFINNNRTVSADAIAVRSKMFDSLTSANTNVSSLSALWQATQEDQENMIKSSHFETELDQFLSTSENQESLDIPVHATSSSYLDIGCLSSEDETSSISDTSDRSTSAFSEGQNKSNNCCDSDNTQSTTSETVREVGGNDSGVFHDDAFKEEVRSRLSMLRKVNSVYLLEARMILHKVLCNEECMCRKPIINLSQADVELMKFGHKESLEKATEMLLTGTLKDAPIEDIFQFKSSEILHSGTESVKKSESFDIENGLDTGVKMVNKQCFPSTSENNDVNVLPRDTLKESPILNKDISKCSLSESLLDSSLNNFWSTEFTHILRIIKMLRSIIAPLKEEGEVILGEATKEASDEYFSAGSVSGKTITSNKSGTLMDLMLEEVVKRVVLKKYEQKMKETSEIISDESFNAMLLNMNGGNDSTVASFPDDMLEEFKSRLTSGGDDSPHLDGSSNNGRHPEEPSVNSQRLWQEISQITKKEKSCNNCESTPINSNATCNKNEYLVIRGDTVCKTRISNICLQLAAKSSINKKVSGSSFDKIRFKKSIDSNISRVEAMSPPEDTSVISQNPSGSGITNSETEMDFNDSIKSLGQRIVNIERFLSDFENNDGRIRGPRRSKEVLEDNSSDDRMLKVIEFPSESNQILDPKSADRDPKSSSSVCVYTSDANFTCEKIGCKSFIMPKNFPPGDTLPVSSVFYSKIEPDKVPKTPSSSEFSFPATVPDITDAKPLHHLVFTKSNWKQLIQDEVNSSFFETPSMLKVLASSNSKSYHMDKGDCQPKLDYSDNCRGGYQTSDVDVEMTHAEVKSLTTKRNLSNFTLKGRFAGKVKESDSGMLIHKLRPKSLIVPSFIKNEITPTHTNAATKDESCSISDSDSFSKTEKMVEEEMKKNSSELIIIQNVTELAISDCTRVQKPDINFLQSRRENINAQSLQSTWKNGQRNRSIGTQLISKQFTRNCNRERDIDNLSVGNEKHHGNSLHTRPINFKQSQSKFINMQKREDAKIPSSTEAAKSSQVTKNVLPTSSHSLFDEMPKKYSENSIDERLISTSTKSLLEEEATTSVLALEPPLNKSTNTSPKSSRLEKHPKPIASSEESASTPIESESHERLIKSAFDLMDSCEKILNCKRRSEEMQSQSSHRCQNSFVTVLKTVDETFVDKMSSYGPGLIFKNQTSQTMDDQDLFNSDSSEVEQRTTEYTQLDSKINVTSSTKPSFGNTRKVLSPNKVNSRSTSYLSTGSEIFYDIPTAESDLAYHIEVECVFNQSCAEIERSKKVSTDRGASAVVESTRLRGRSGSAPENHSTHALISSKLTAEKPLEENARIRGWGKKPPTPALFDSCDSEFRTIEFESPPNTRLRRCETFVKEIRRSASEIFSRRNEKCERVRAGADRCCSISSSHEEKTRGRERKKSDQTAMSSRMKVPGESISSWESHDRKYSCSDIKAVPIRDHESLEKKLTLLRDSLKEDCKCPRRQRPTDRPEPECFRPLCRDRRMNEKLRRSLFTGHNSRRKQTELSESSVESKISRRFRSDGENVVAVNADIVMEFFERVYGVYDHIRHCKSCKTLMSRIIEEVISDLAVVRGKA